MRARGVQVHERCDRHPSTPRLRHPQIVQTHHDGVGLHDDVSPSRPRRELTARPTRSSLDHAVVAVSGLRGLQRADRRGFVGSLNRRIVFDGAPVSLTCSTKLVVDPDAQLPGIGALLLRRMLHGGAGHHNRWCGGRHDCDVETARRLSPPIGRLAWARPLRPFHTARRSTSRRCSTACHSLLHPLGWCPPTTRPSCVGSWTNSTAYRVADVLS